MRCECGNSKFTASDFYFTWKSETVDLAMHWVTSEVTDEEYMETQADWRCTSCDREPTPELLDQIRHEWYTRL